ncbi:hypothetical protein BA950_05180 [Erythrobacter sp. SAORIC-644]|uniref:nSTAND3 domain-containing NTPase n=1 Tax=Erythrobacter sp. SAORIC-644 TaxID=1869314 RepID=UPI000C9FD091|nr:hypothetical protein [Erythrobacter sp. SAORIC-644]PNQ77419.1 hypothetical protein BA950_05180 [Erythrobacter sp. SAORIC-644]
MTIAIIGPEKFAFQDLVCVDLALTALANGPVALVPEQAGHEDATLSWPAEEGVPTATLEVQIKGAAGTFDMAMLAEHLLHYPDRAGKGSLLERLMDAEGRAALFVVSARCVDILTPLLLDRAPRALVEGREVTTAIAEALRTAVTAVGHKSLPKKPSKLKEARRLDAQALAARPLGDYARALCHLAIVEGQTAEVVEVRLHHELQRRRFDTLSIRGVLASLTDLLSSAKRSQTDVVPNMLRELESRAPQAVRPADYYDRGIETALFERLEDQRAVLLAGPPRAGKTWTARRIGGELQQLGFEVRSGSHIDEAERFLTDPIGAARLYILDDPLGAREPLPDASARLGALRQLIERLPPNRRIVAAQTESVLLQIRGAADLDDCSIGVRPWIAITPLAPEPAIAIWRAAAADQGIAKTAIDRVTKLIERNEQLREPGALAYLAQTFDGLPDNVGDAEILFQARSDAVDFARALAGISVGSRTMLSAAALATNPGQAAALPELAFIANGGTARPGFEPESYVISFGTDPRPVPTYLVPPQLADGQVLAVDDLQRRRVLEQSDSGLNFTHPYLRAGAQALLRPDIPGDLDRLVEQVERSLACVHSSTSLAAARNLRWLRAAVPAKARSSIFEIARNGVRSLFPATRDACFAFLVDMADELSPSQRDRLPGLADRVSIGLEDIDISNGIGFITDQPDMFAFASPLNEIQPYLSAIEAGEPLGLDLALGRRILLTLERHPDAMTAEACRRFLRADEAVIRAAAASAWLARPREGDEDIIEWLAHDFAPSISAAILNSVTDSWKELDASRRKELTEVLRAQATSPGCASVLLNRLVLFNRPEHYGDEPPWSLFADLMPTVVEHLPLSVSFQNGRLNAALDDALMALPAEALAPVVEAWAYRLQRRLPYRMLDEYELSVVEPLLAALRPDRRLPLLRDLLGVADTGARVVTMKWLIDHWDDLVADEHTLLSGSLAEGRDDARWLAATVLTRSEPPGRLVKQLGGDAELLEGTSEQIEAALGFELFAACIRTYRGDPQPLWWYAIHHSKNPTWPRIVRALARSSDHPLFGEAFVEIAAFGEKGELRDTVAALPDTALIQAFELLLQFKLGCTGFWRDKSWAHLLERAESAGLLDEMFDRIDAVSDGILEDLRDTLRWFGEGPYADRLIELYPRDTATLVDLRYMQDICDMLLKGEAGHEPTEPDIIALLLRAFIKNQVEKLEAEPCRLFKTWDILSDALKANGGDASLEVRIAAGRKAALERHQALRESHVDVTADIQLDGWIDQARQ